MSSLGIATLVLLTYTVLLGPFYFIRFRLWRQDQRKSGAPRDENINRRLAA